MTRVGILFPGETGALVASAAQADVLWASEGRSEATGRRARTAGLRDAGSLAALARDSEVVLSICPPAIEEEVARAVAEAGFRGSTSRGTRSRPRGRRRSRMRSPRRESAWSTPRSSPGRR